MGVSGSLLFVDVAHGRIFEAADCGIEVVLEYDGNPNGLAVAPHGDIVVADGRNGLMWVHRDRGRLVEGRTLTALGEDPFLGLNDLAFDVEGNLFVTDQGMTGLHDPSGRVLRHGADGSLSVFLNGIPSPNGLALGNGGRRELLLAVTRDNAIWRVPFDDRYRPFRVGRFIQMSGGVGPDGIALNGNGFLFVAHLGLGVVRVFDEVGRPAGVYETPNGLNPTNVALAEDEKLIYVTEADSAQILVGDASPYV